MPAQHARPPVCFRQRLPATRHYSAPRTGNVALAFMATGSVYLGGGIAPKIVARLTQGGFMRAFVGKGRLTPLLEQIPVRVIINDRAALLGASRIAADRLRLLQSPPREVKAAVMFGWLAHKLAHGTKNSCNSATS